MGKVKGMNNMNNINSEKEKEKESIINKKILTICFNNIQLYIKTYPKI